jgi:hypothetical protein
MDEFKPIELSNVMWAYAALEARARATQRSFQPLLHSQHAESFPLVQRPFKPLRSLSPALGDWASGEAQRLRAGAGGGDVCVGRSGKQRTRSVRHDRT